jgi:peptidyl-prolyl cis-trans isomerase C
MKNSIKKAGDRLTMKSIVKCACWLMAGTALAAAAAADDTKPAASPEISVNDLLGDKVVARGKGFEIKRSQLDQAVVDAKADASARGQDIPDSDQPILELRSLQYLIRLELLNGVATDDQKAKGRDEADKYYEELKKRSGSEDVLTRKFKALGLTAEMFRKDMVEEAIANAVLAAKVDITPADIKKFYDDNPDDFEKPEEARLLFITMGGPDHTTGTPLTEGQKAEKKKEIEGLRDRAIKGDDFGQLARDYSEDTTAKDNNGAITIVRGMRGLPLAFETTAFGLQTNQVSDIITTDYGFHIMKLIEKVPAGKATLTEATTAIKARLERDKIAEILPPYEAQLRKDAAVEIVDPRLKELEANAPPAAGLTPSAPARLGTGTN